MHINHPVDTTTITVAVCPRCGTTRKSGTRSCCGRGGSWFRICGGAGNTKLHHTWHEGIQACKTRSQSKSVIGHQLNGAQQKDIDSSQGAGMENYKAVITATNMFAFTSVNTSTPMSDTTSIITPSYVPEKVLITTTSAPTLMTNMPNALTIYSTHTSTSKAISTQGYVYLHVLAITVYIYFL